MPSFYVYVRSKDDPADAKPSKIRLADPRAVTEEDAAAIAAVSLRNVDILDVEKAGKPTAMLKPVPTKFTEFGIKKGLFKREADGRLVDSAGKTIFKPKAKPPAKPATPPAPTA